MKVQMIGCSHHTAPVEVRERLAFSPEQARAALELWNTRFPNTEAVLLSTCNRVEFYLADEDGQRCPSHHDIVEFMAGFHGLESSEIFDDLYERTGEDAVRHLFTVAASLDSMVVGEAQILSQVKQAYELARVGDHAGTLMHLAFQAANRVAKRVASETAINQKRVSIPSVAVADFASQIFEQFDDKRVLVAGAGEMAEETLRYLIDEGVRDVTIVNRSMSRAKELAARTCGIPAPFERLHELLADADLVVSTTAASEPIVTAEQFRAIESRRGRRPLFILDLAIPRDFDPEISRFGEVYLYAIDDLKAVCDKNRQARQKEWPKAERIIEEETRRFMVELNHRTTGPTIKRLTAQANQLKDRELERLLKKLGTDVDERAAQEIERSFARLVNKLLHPPLESLRDEAESGMPHGLLEALARLFKLKD